MQSKYDKLKKLPEGEFKRVSGVKRSTFKVMLAEVKKPKTKGK